MGRLSLPLHSLSICVGTAVRLAECPIQEAIHVTFLFSCIYSSLLLSENGVGFLSRRIVRYMLLVCEPLVSQRCCQKKKTEQ
jgi:hypothetical protein